jgi:Ni,Fe-hydrogenase III component G
MIDQIVETLKKNLSGLITNVDVSDFEIYVDVKPEYILDTCCFIYKNIDCSLISVFANDERLSTGNFRVYYVFALKRVKAIIIFRTNYHENSEGLDTISVEIPAASLPERETRDMYGIKFKNLPDER